MIPSSLKETWSVVEESWVLVDDLVLTLTGDAG
jgi:hypothetical protein